MGMPGGMNNMFGNNMNNNMMLGFGQQPQAQAQQVNLELRCHRSFKQRFLLCVLLFFLAGAFELLLVPRFFPQLVLLFHCNVALLLQPAKKPSNPDLFSGLNPL